MPSEIQYEDKTLERPNVNQNANADKRRVVEKRYIIKNNKEIAINQNDIAR